MCKLQSMIGYICFATEPALSKTAIDSEDSDESLQAKSGVFMQPIIR